MNKKINLLFDVTVLGQQYYAGNNGIFNTAYNILLELMDDPKVDVYLYYEPEFYWELSFLQKAIPVNKIIKTYTRKKVIVFSKLLFFIKTQLIAKRETIHFRIIYKSFSFMIKTLIKFGNIICIQNNEFIAKLKSFDIYFSPCYKPPKVIGDCGEILCFTLLHDIIPIKLKLYYNKWFFELSKYINSNDYYFNNSAFTRNDFITYFPQIDPEKSFVTHLAASAILKNITDDTELSNVKLKYGIPENLEYVLSICSLEERKNLIIACTAFIDFIKKNDIHNLIFVLGGTNKHGFYSKLKQSICEDDFRYIRYIDYVDDTDLSALYSGCRWFVYTSSYEGFGLPLLEAMQCGCPVIASNATSLPEVVGDAGLLIDYNSVEQHIQAYNTYYFNHEICRQNIQKGLERVKLFSWKKTVESMKDAFEIALTRKI